MNAARACLGCVVVVAIFLPAANAADTSLPPPLRSVNPRTLSSGLYLALTQDGAFGGISSRSAAREAALEINKGRPPALLDARVGDNLRVGADPAPLPSTQRAQAEPHLWRSAVAPEFIVATFQEGRYAAGGGSLDCGYGISRDGGFTWTRALVPQLTASSGGSYVRATDPVAAVDLEGNVFLNTLAARQQGFADGGVVVISRSTDGGQTFGSPTVVAAAPNNAHVYDKNWMAVNDFAGTPNANRLVVAFADITGNNSYDLVACVSDDHGLTWSSPTLVKPHNALINQSVMPCFLPDGSLLVAYITALTDISMRIECRRSADGGHTFPGSSTVVVPNVSLWSDPVLRHGSFLITAWVARTSGAVFLTYVGRDANGVPRAFVVRSTDRGATWSTPVAASDNGPGVSVVNSAVAASPDGQQVVVSYYDKRNDTGAGNLVDLYANTSFDGGASWRSGVRLTEYSSDVRSAPLTNTGYMLGDYQGLVPPLTSGQSAIALTIDTRHANPDPFAIRYALSATEDFRAWQSARFNLSELADANFSSAAADPDGDGFANLAEYALASNPRVAESGTSFEVTTSAPDVVTMAQRLRTTSDFAIRYEAQTGTTWTVLTPYESTVFTPPSGVAGTTSTATNSFHLGQPTVIRAAFDLDTAGTFAVSTPDRYAFRGDARLVNVSTRGAVGTGASQLIVGFVLDGAKDVLARGGGPLLTSLGVTGVLADPQLRIVRASDGADVASNDNWGSATASPILAQTAARLGATPFVDGSADAALTTRLASGVYTVLISGVNATSGVGLGEIYDADTMPGASNSPRLTNLSARGQVGAASESTLIAGFVITGTQPRRVFLRAVGPGLTGAGLTSLLADPRLTVFHHLPYSTPVIATNDDWSFSRTPVDVLTTLASRLGAFALTTNSLDAAVLLTLDPGVYTVQVTGPAAQTGIALVEVYDAD